MTEDNEKTWMEERDAWIEKHGVPATGIHKQSEDLYPIDHNAIMDGFLQLKGFKEYIPFYTFCRICQSDIRVSSKDQKYILEANTVPVKQLGSSVYCKECLQRRVAIKRLSQHAQDKKDAPGKIQLQKLMAEENEIKKQAKRPKRYKIDWPYK